MTLTHSSSYLSVPQRPSLNLESVMYTAIIWILISSTNHNVKMHHFPVLPLNISVDENLLPKRILGYHSKWYLSLLLNLKNYSPIGEKHFLSKGNQT